MLIGRPNWMRSNACSRASSNMARLDPDQLVAQRQLAQGCRLRSSRRAWRRQVDDAGDLEEAERRVEPVHRPALQYVRRQRQGDVALRRPDDGDDAVGRGQRRRGQPVDESHASRWTAGGSDRRSGGSTTATRPSATRPRAAPSNRSSAVEVTPARPWLSNSSETAVRRSSSSASAQPRSSRAASSSVPLLDSVARRMAPSKSSRSRRVHQRSSPSASSRRAMMLR